MSEINFDFTHIFGLTSYKVSQTKQQLARPKIVLNVRQFVWQILELVKLKQFYPVIFRRTDLISNIVDTWLNRF